MTTPSERSMIARLGAHEKWARCDDRAAATAPMRLRFEARFLTLADPDGVLQAAITSAGGTDSPEGRQLLRQLTDRVEQRRKAYFTRLALASAKARSAKASKVARDT